MAQCPYCGAQHDGGKFCGSCGRQLVSEGPGSGGMVNSGPTPGAGAVPGAYPGAVPGGTPYPGTPGSYPGAPGSYPGVYPTAMQPPRRSGGLTWMIVAAVGVIVLVGGGALLMKGGGGAGPVTSVSNTGGDSGAAGGSGSSGSSGGSAPAPAKPSGKPAKLPSDPNNPLVGGYVNIRIPGAAYTQDSGSTTTMYISSGAQTTSSLLIWGDGTYAWNSQWDGKLIKGSWWKKENGLILQKAQEGKDWFVQAGTKETGGDIVIMDGSIWYLADRAKE